MCARYDLVDEGAKETQRSRRMVYRGPYHPRDRFINVRHFRAKPLGNIAVNAKLVSAATAVG